MACRAIDCSLTLAAPEDTTRLGERLAGELARGDTVLLEGPIGAGKSHLARALIQARLAAAGRMEDVPSPTFTLVQTYDDGRAEIWHADLYRLSGPAEIDDLGLWEAFENAICLIEWPDRLGPYSPAWALRIALAPLADGPGRDVRLSSDDPAWSARLRRAGIVTEPVI